MSNSIDILEEVPKIKFGFNPQFLAFTYFDYTETVAINKYLSNQFRRGKIVYTDSNAGPDGFNFFAVDKILVSAELGKLNKTTAGNWVVQKDFFDNSFN